MYSEETEYKKVKASIQHKIIEIMTYQHPTYSSLARFLGRRLTDALHRTVMKRSWRGSLSTVSIITEIKIIRFVLQSVY